MVFERTTALAGSEVIARAKEFFSERVPERAAFPETQSATHVVLRGQGGEEIAISTHETPEGTRVRGSTLLFDQALDRFLSTLPTPEEASA